MNGFIVDLKNEPGSLAKLTEAIAAKGINITAFSGATSGGCGAAALLTNDEEGTRRTLADAGFTTREIEVASTSIEHKPGGLAAVARKLADAGVNIEAAFVTGVTDDGNPTVAFLTDQPAKAKSILGSAAPSAIGVG
jgi:hypothetical protein